MNNLFFDLDGTLVNSEKGIMKGLKYMYNNTLGYVPHDDNTLRKFIGPTFSTTFKKFDNIDVNTPEGMKRVKKFREYYDVEGWKELAVIDGVYEMLEELKHEDKEIFVATSKPEVHAKKIIDMLDMKQYVRHVFGASDDDVSRSLKEDVISYGINKTSVNLNSDNLVMVGDRSSDIVGAHKNNLKAIGVTYGFGEYDELSNAKSDWIVNKPLEIAKLALEN
ncbi:HAD hydrolase-like protein [Companilactobacillus mishanensis]|uniref:HAD hydrolase-like protein n=1 Tax=Companilactobacillus mishanensis TaxID=2486008 RepID=UPI0012981A33|nr:HAD hydrolase-like protein [Companilactobacillus mishanensis]MQS89182.1 HAD family hydrolase [Companilactobacillus mishanensis]